jgi:uncharacterized protein YecE (DUF72 family)
VTSPASGHDGIVAVYVGTSGWQYRHWRDTFYPKGVAQNRWLEFYAQHFTTVELNVTFYRQPKPETFAQWAQRSPDGFVFAAKASRYLTHIKRLREPDASVRYYMDGARRLGAKLGPILLQLPPNLAADVDALDGALAVFPADLRLAVEPRHPSWFADDRVRAVLERRGAALCLADTPRHRAPVWRTTDWTYVRFHEGRSTPHPCYGRDALARWAQRIAEQWNRDDDVYAYFNNDGRACALRDARVFAAACERAGLAPTRVAPKEAVHLAP